MKKSPCTVYTFREILWRLSWLRDMIELALNFWCTYSISKWCLVIHFDRASDCNSVHCSEISVADMFILIEDEYLQSSKDSIVLSCKYTSWWDFGRYVYRRVLIQFWVTFEWRLSDILDLSTDDRASGSSVLIANMWDLNTTKYQVSYNLSDHPCLSCWYMCTDFFVSYQGSRLMFWRGKDLPIGRWAT